MPAVNSNPHAYAGEIGSMDLHLFNEGRHTKLYEKLGAHPIAREGRAGWVFRVWAPNARSVSLIGTFNGWNPRATPMTPLASSGIWERFMPGLDRGEGRVEPGPPVLGLGGSGGDAREVLDRGRRTGDQLVGQRARLEALRHGVGGGQQLVGVQRLQQVGGGGQHAVVRAQELVRRAREQVRAERGQVDPDVGGEVDRVDVHQRAGRIRPHFQPPPHAARGRKQRQTNGEKDRGSRELGHKEDSEWNAEEGEKYRVVSRERLERPVATRRRN